jgi:ornithine cyclodeaminase/alanine dehydrogenase-like protein (mu-crystallin family)
VVAILGSGVQARSHLETLCAVKVLSKCARGARRRSTFPALLPMLVRSQRFPCELLESSDIVQGIWEGRFGAAHISGEMGEVVVGRVPGRAAADAVVIFKSLGMAVEDVAAAQLAYRRALEPGIGREVST